MVAAQRRRAEDALRASEMQSHAKLARLAKGVNDEPLPSNGWYWSVSHSRDWSAGIVSHSPVGIDVERIAERGLELQAAVASPSERALFTSFSDRELLRVWTAKEAVLKKAGVGLAELSAARVVEVPSDVCIVISHRRRPHLVHQSERYGYVAALSADAADEGDGVEVIWTWEARDGERGG
jgi:4'-phosphopantetheinyl transferase